ncbi:MAG TPA: NfeD family protein [Bacilli bacterium]|jgi:membrane protein implicated in regulation of membrane protease activity|nr:NfeD family protein [Bacilli bacterium]MDD4303836.1 NfeD family protein [Bacilli bacterium]HNY74972.1 NfeD family protein [Bacilli bacterium]HOH68451.1 NfeD family protein [Bacilli bacterium]HOR21062.1 NfeD family protein [Bacilli bacterium]
MPIESIMIWIWLGIFVLSVIIEAVEPDLVSIWFAAGALLAIILSIIPGVPFWVEIIVFLVVSFVLIFAIRPLAKKYLYKKEIKSNIEEKIGEKCVVIKAINELAHGEVKLNGVIWTAIARNKKEVFEEQSVVTIVGIDGNKLIVEKFETGKEEK